MICIVKFLQELTPGVRVRIITSGKADREVEQTENCLLFVYEERKSLLYV